jgi:hypothetical protein
VTPGNANLQIGVVQNRPPGRRDWRSRAQFNPYSPTQAAKTKGKTLTVSPRCQMLKKYGKFYADWEDQFHKRHRKSFHSKAQALKFQAAKREESATKKARASAPSHKSAKPGPRRTPTATTKKQPSS